MKTYRVGRYVVFSFLGLCILAAGVILLVTVQDAQGIMVTIPYICIGLGCGIFGGNLGSAINNRIMQKNPDAARKVEIETNDERNIAIRNKAKGKAYDLMVLVFGALMLAMALMRVDMYVILAFVATYLFVVASNCYYLVKYGKEM